MNYHIRVKLYAYLKENKNSIDERSFTKYMCVHVYMCIYVYLLICINEKNCIKKKY